jgi:hypothetical protein
MGFRNPVTSLSGSQITPGIITGSVVQTAVAGKRVRISGDAGEPGTPGIEFFSGDPGEYTQGWAKAGIALAIGLDPNKERPFLTLRSPDFHNGPGEYGDQSANLSLRGGSRDGLIPPAITTEIPLDAPNMPQTLLWGTGGTVLRPQTIFIDGYFYTDAAGILGPFDVSPAFSAVHGLVLTGKAIAVGIVAEVVSDSPAAVTFRVWRTTGTLATSVGFPGKIVIFGAGL